MPEDRKTYALVIITAEDRTRKGRPNITTCVPVRTMHRVGLVNVQDAREKFNKAKVLPSGYVICHDEIIRHVDRIVR